MSELQTENNQQNFLAIIQKVVLDPSVNVEKMEKILDVQERILDKQAELEFNQAMSLAMVKVPSVERKTKGQTKKYATFESINKIVKPIISQHGLYISFITEFQSDNFLMVTAKITHKAGHSQETSMRFPFDPSGNKNAIQAVGSAISYGKRYTMNALLNITTHDEDDDGFSTSKTIGKIEIERLNNGLAKSGIGLDVLCKYMKVERLSDIKLEKYNNALVYLNAIIDSKGKQNEN
jgi:hypothetical protein